MTPLLAKLFEKAGFVLSVNYGNPFINQKPKRKGGRDKSFLPHSYPGAKMARMAVMQRIGVRHLGMRLDIQPTK
jgi:hypothetical protein